MPNHLHGILWILDPDQEPDSFWSLPTSTKLPQSPRGTSPPPEWFNPGALNGIIEQVKFSALQQIRTHQYVDVARFWQRDYFELYIQTEREFNAIREYLLTDPFKRADDPIRAKFSIY